MHNKHNLQYIYIFFYNLSSNNIYDIYIFFKVYIIKKSY